MTNKQFLQNRLEQYTEYRENAREDGDFAMFTKWEFEVNNVKTLIEMNDKSEVEE